MAALLLKDIPESIRKVLIREQAKQKEKMKTNKFGLENTIYLIIGEWAKLRKKEKVADDE